MEVVGYFIRPDGSITTEPTEEELDRLAKKIMTVTAKKIYDAEVTFLDDEVETA